MKKVKYIGELEQVLPKIGKLVKKGDIIEVEKDFFNSLFEEVKDEVENLVDKKTVKNREENK